MGVTERELDSLGELQLRDSRVVRLLDYWQVLRGEARLPRYRDVDPIAIPSLLPHVWFWRYDKERGTFFGRLAGEAVLEVFGSRDMRGLPLEKFVEPAMAQTLHDRYLRVLQQPAALHFDGSTMLQGGARIGAERLILPMHDQSEDSQVVIGLSIYDWPRDVRSAPGFERDEGVINWAPLP